MSSRAYHLTERVSFSYYKSRSLAQIKGGVQDSIGRHIATAMWGGLSNAATVAQLAGVDTLGLISKIRLAARTARQNRKDCEHLAHLVAMLGELLPRLRDPEAPEAARPLAGLGNTLAEAHELIVDCQEAGRTQQFFTASRKAEKFREVEKKINSYLSVISLVSHIGIARRLDGIMDNDVLSSSSRSQLGYIHIKESEANEEFTLAEIVVATNNFAVVLSDGDSGKVYKGKLHNGREVAVKRLMRRRGAEDAFVRELEILSPLRHDNIVRFLGRCAEDGELIVVTQYSSNGSLYDHLHGREPPSSPVTASWRARVQVLLGAARAIKHLHCRAVPLIIHGNVTSSNILLDAAWAPRLSEFGRSFWRAAGVDSQPVECVTGASEHGYADPECCRTGRIKPASDVYNLGVVMLEVLTGNPPVVTVWDERSRSMVPMTLVSFALPSIQAGRLVDVLDRRPLKTPTTWQLEPLQLLANTAARCLCLYGDNRPAMAEVVVQLEQSLELICRHGNF